MNQYQTYEVHVPTQLMDDTDDAIRYYLMLHPDDSVDDAIDAIFNSGVQVIQGMLLMLGGSMPS